MQETPIWSLGQEDPLEKEMATHSSTLVWKSPWMEEPDGLYIVHGVAKSRTQLSDFTFTLLWLHPTIPAKSRLLPSNHFVITKYSQSSPFLTYEDGVRESWVGLGYISFNHLVKFILLFILHFYWNIVSWQCCVSFYYIVKWIGYTYKYISSFLDFLPF